MSGLPRHASARSIVPEPSLTAKSGRPRGDRKGANEVAYTLRYHPGVAEDDLPDIPKNLRQRIARSIEERLTTSPEHYGVPLKGSLKGYWKLRVGDYRVVFRIVGSEVRILTVLHRQAVYEAVRTRLG